jgi:hypothetical protein
MAKKSLDQMALGSHQERAFPPVFLKSGRIQSVFPTGPETGSFTGFSGTGF